MVPIFFAVSLFRSTGDGPIVEPVRTVVTRIGRSLGRTVEAERSLQGIPVLVDEQGATRLRTLRTLAFALHATVVEDGKTLRIERTGADRKGLRATHVAVDRARIEKGIATWDRILKRADGLGDIEAQVRRARADLAQTLREGRAAIEAHRAYAVPPDFMGESMVTPAARLLRGLMARIGSERLANLAPGEVRFWSDRPNGAQAPLPRCDDLLASYVASQTTFASAMGLPNPGATPGRIVLRTTESGASVDLYDTRGKRLDQGFSDYDMVTVVTGAPDPYARPSPKEAWRALDEPSVRFLSLYRAPFGSLRPERLPDEYLHSERFDPLGYEVRTGILALPRASGTKGFVAVLSDDPLVGASRFVQEGRLDAESFARSLTTEGGFERVTNDGMAVLRPIDALDSETRITDREALGREIRKIVADRSTQPSNWSRLHLSLYNGSAQPAAARYRRLLPRLDVHAIPNIEGRADGAYALLGAGLQAGVGVVDGGKPPFDRLIADGVRKGWLRFTGGPGTSDLDLAPSSLLGGLRSAKIAWVSSEVPVAEHYGAMTLEEIRAIPMGGMEAEALGARAIGLLGPQPAELRTEAWKRRAMETTVLDLHYRLGRQVTLAADVLLEGGFRAHVEVQDRISDRDGLAFGELPKAFQEGVLRGARRTLDNPGKGK